MKSGDVLGIGLSIIAWIFFVIVVALFVLSCMYYIGGVE